MDIKIVFIGLFYCLREHQSAHYKILKLGSILPNRLKDAFLAFKLNLLVYF